VTTKTGESATVHYALHEVVALHTVLVRGSVWKMSERSLTQSMIFQFPEVLQL
jgi:hypothetical protein